MNQDYLWFKVGAAVAAVMTFAYSNFVTKDFLKEAVTDRLDRIEQKIDHLR